MGETLSEIVKRYPSDKCIEFGHDYISGYNDLFHNIQENVTCLLEIGTGCLMHEKAMQCSCKYENGNSIRMWRDYFTNAKIYAIDIYEEGMIYGEDRIETFVADQSSHEDLTRIKQNIGLMDIIIDDGSHESNHQVFSFMNLEMNLNEKGIYVIEDVKYCYIQSFKDLSIFPLEYRSYILSKYDVKWYDTREKKGIPDDFLMVFQRKSL